MPEPLELGLPPLFRRSLAYLCALDEEEFERFLHSVSDSSPSSPSEELVDRFASVLPEREGRSITGLLQFLMSTRGLTTTFEADPATIASAVARAYQSPEDHVAQLVERRVSALLSSDFVALREKSLDLASEAETVLRDSRAITDLRPVFTDSSSTEEVAGFLIVHTLKLDVDGKADSLFISVDHGSIEKLIRVLKRALEKEERLERLLAESKIADLSLRGER